MTNTLFILYCIPNERIVVESGARRTTTSFFAANIRQARAMGVMRFVTEYPQANDEDFQFIVYEDQPGLPRPEIDGWDEDMLYQYEWDEKSQRPGESVKTTKPSAVEFDKLSELMRVSVLVKFGTTEINSDQLHAAMELTQDNASTFEGHIVEAISKMPQIAKMFPERILEVLDHIREKSSANAKWPDIKATAAAWLKQYEQDRKDGTLSEAAAPAPAPAPAPAEIKMGSGDPDRFDLVLALLVMGKDPATAGASDVKNAKHIKESRDPAWRGWRTTLIGIPGIYSFPEKLLYELTQAGMKDLNLIADSVGRREYVREHFAGHPLLPDYIADETEDEAEQNTSDETDEPAHEAPEVGSVEQNKSDAERTGPFYFLFSDGQKFGRANKQSGLEKALAEGCTEITQEEYFARKNGTYKAPQEVTEKASAQTEVKKIADGVFSVENLMGEQPKTPTAVEPPPSNEVEKTEVVAAQPAFQTIAAALETDLAEKGDNLKIWRSVMRTDPRYTKDLAGAGFEGTSINAEYMVMRATEIFGPIGTGWGFEVMEDRMLPGAPMSEAIYEDKKFVGNRLLRDGDGTLITEKNHSIKIKFWYAIEGDIRGEVEAYGATKYLYKTKHGITCDGEAQKKSLTDAIKKALSLLGFSADVWLGLYDQAEYKQENAIEFDIRNASDKAEDVTRIRKELDEKFKLNTDSMRSAVTPNEISGIASSLTRVMGVHLKAAREKGDAEYSKYLEGRLRRLEEVKSECLAKLQEKAA